MEGSTQDDLLRFLLTPDQTGFSPFTPNAATPGFNQMGEATQCQNQGQGANGGANGKEGGRMREWRG